MKPVAINYHLIRACDASCRFCFATFRDVAGRLPTSDARRLLDRLRAAGGEKITFAGGEPTLHPDLGELLRHAKELGFTTCVVTNGFNLGDLLDAHAAALDWAGLSIDSGSESVQAALGRGRGDHVARCVDLADRCRAEGVRVKLNTVVTAETWWGDLAPLVRRVRPERWKVFQVLPIAGQNDESVEDLLISREQFRAFVQRHAHLAAEGLAPVVEDNDAMLSSYVMVDPLGRFFGNATGRHIYSQPILEVGVEAALAQVGFEPARFEARGGRYAW